MGAERGVKPDGSSWLEERGWECKESITGDVVYRKRNTYGWFNYEGAVEHELDGIPDQYPDVAKVPAV